MSLKKLERVSVSFDYPARAVRFDSGKFFTRFYVKGGKLLPESNSGSSTTDSHDLSVRLMAAAVIAEVAVWANEPTEDNAEKVRTVVEAFNSLMEADPQVAADVAVTHGLQTLRTMLERKDRSPKARGYPVDFLGSDDLSKFEFREVNVSFEKCEGDRAVRMSCGPSSVLLLADKNRVGYAVGAVEEVGPQEDVNGYNIRATFVALKDAFVKYLVLDELDQDLLEDAIIGWEDLKKEEPNKARKLLPALLSGDVVLEMRRTTVSEEMAQELLARHQRGELTDDQLVRAMTDERSDDTPLH